MKSKIEVRKFAVECAIKVMGAGVPIKNVVDKSREIEAYVMGDAILPEVYDETAEVGNMAASILGALSNEERQTEKKGK